MHGSTQGDGATVIDVVRSAFSHALEVPAAQIDVSVHLSELPGMESVRFLRALAVLEEKLEIAIPDDVLYEIDTLSELTEWLRRDGADLK